MKHFGKTLGGIMEEKRLNAEAVATGIGCKVPNVYKILQKETVSLRMLEDVCRGLGVSPVVFLDPELLSNEMPGVAGMAAEVQRLKEKIEEKERLIQEKERFIRFLMKHSEASEMHADIDPE